MVADSQHHRNTGSRTTLVGRGPELKRIVDALESTKHATPATILVEGATGIGKTALLDAACDLAQARGFVVCRAKASPMERELPFAVVQQLFEHLREELSQGQDGEGTPHGHGAIAGHFTAEVRDMDDVHVLRAIRDVYRFTVRLAQRAPLCLVVDDVQWADVPSLRWLNYLLHRVAKLPVVTLLTRTPGIRPADPLLIAELELYSQSTRLTVFTAQDVVQLTEQVLGRTPDGSFVEAVLQATGGCPMVTSHVLGQMRERSTPPDEEAAGALPGLDPEELGRSMLARLNRQSRQLVEVAKAIAVVEPDDLDLLTAVMGVSNGAAADLVRQLEGMGLLAPDDELAFSHPVIKTAIGGAVPYQEREELHAKAARHLHRTRAPAPVVAHHVLRTSSRLGAWAVAALRTTADTATAAGDPRTGAKLLSRALDEELSTSQRKDLLVRLGLAEVYFDPRMAVVHLEEGMTGLDDPEEVLAVACRLAQVLYFDGAYDSASEVLRRTEAEIGSKIPAVVEMLRLLERITVPSRTQTTGQVDFRQFDEQEWRRGDEHGRRLAGLIAEDASNRGIDLPLCRKTALAALSGGAPAILHYPQRMVGVLNSLLRADEAELVMRYCDEILLEAHREGLSLIVLLGHTLRSRAHYHRGSFAEAVADAELALSAARTAALPPDHFGQVYAVDAQVRAQLALGDVKAAENALRPFGRFRALPSTWHHTALLHSRGALRMELGDTEGALADQLECGERFEAWGRPSPALRPWRSYAALAHLKLGQRDPALDLALREVELARKWGAPSVIGRALLTMGIVTGGAAAAPWLTEAESVLRPSSARMLHAQVLLELAGTLGEKGQHNTARNHLAEAKKLGEQCGVAVQTGEKPADPVSARTARARIPRPAEPTKVVPPGPRANALALTPHEHRVAGLVLEGNSNDEIARKLSVSRRTVEFHLTSIYRKLGVRRRTQLPSALAGFVSRR
ncbi:helix-turn-helix transcriptional regulator [Lentzea jiangxiensis]|uniref:Predicted ATPase n=1 Tax=Lentzea jiangxiensis TaxID=641025 RepID=A0A1H0S6Q7_9PSEU|nr:LuxR family transcriptional regulator [Lentzea jiangxiensis]SDP36908.1 Predicted ATPase [Lentzea jiangxiensis]